MLPTCEIIEFVAEDTVTPGTRDMQYEFEGREIKHDGRPTQPAFISGGEVSMAAALPFMGNSLAAWSSFDHANMLAALATVQRCGYNGLRHVRV